LIGTFFLTDGCVRACVQEMGNSAVVQQEQATLELMEKNPAMELTERTKKLRQMNYKRRNARGGRASVTTEG
jgi:hypothetical protein